MCNCDCSPRRVRHTIGGSNAADVKIDLPDNIFIWDIIIAQNGDAVSGTTVLNFKAPGLSGTEILKLAAGTANLSSSYAVMRQGSSNAGAALSGTSVPVYIPNGGITLTITGTPGTNAATATIVFSECPPPWR